MQVRLEPNHVRRHCPPPVARHGHMAEAPRYPKSESAHARDAPIAEPVHIHRIEVRPTGSEDDPGVGDRPQKRANTLVHEFLRAAGYGRAKQPGSTRSLRAATITIEIEQVPGRPARLSVRSRHSPSFEWPGLRRQRRATRPESRRRVSTRNRSSGHLPTRMPDHRWRARWSADERALPLPRRHRRRCCRRRLRRTRSFRRPGTIRQRRPQYRQER